MSVSNERKATLILALIALSEGIPVLWLLLGNGWRFVAYMGFAPGRAGTALGWAAALLVVIGFVRVSLRMPSVRANLWRPSGLKLLAVAVAITAGILEEAVFRKTIMDAAMRHGLTAPTQVLLSALAFGVAHGVWGLFGRSLRAAVGATVATGLLGGALAIVYVVAGRSLAPCIAAHFAINLAIEPGLVLAATRGEMRARAAE
jgi:membrane protease YdiL (CAAX protease family)